MFSLRALHIELAGDLTTYSFILVLCRFTVRKGNPCRCSTRLVKCNTKIRPAQN